MASIRTLVADTWGKRLTNEVWSGDYHGALPVTLNDYDLSAVLPTVFYLFRFGVRRGMGYFLETFGIREGTPAERRRSATVERVTAELATSDGFSGFGNVAERAILGDLLLCFCLENAKRAEGQTQQVQRIAAAHYMASWVDLPQTAANLRRVPELIVSLLADQESVDFVKIAGKGKSWFPVGDQYEDNLLLRAFSHGVSRRGMHGDYTADRFDEECDSVGLDQLLQVRMATKLGSAPQELRGSGGARISNQRPISERATQEFSDDIRRFLRAYASTAPRHALVDMLESCMAIGLTTMLSSTVEMLLHWADDGHLPSPAEQSAAEVLVDCSSGVDRRVRDCAEQSMDDRVRRLEALPDILMVLRILDHHAKNNRRVRDQPSTPFATAWLNTLGEILHQRHAQAERIHERVDERAEELADALPSDLSEIGAGLKNEESQPNPVWRLAQALTRLMGRNLRQHLLNFVDSSLMIDRPNGIAVKRKSSRGGRRRDVRSLVLTDSALEYLVHVHVLRGGSKSGVRKLSLREFTETLRGRYGFCIDVAPRGMSVSNELLLINRTRLERRLRDLGLLVGVNDAESMKRLKPRFEPEQGV